MFFYGMVIEIRSSVWAGIHLVLAKPLVVFSGFQLQSVISFSTIAFAPVNKCSLSLRKLKLS